MIGTKHGATATRGLASDRNQQSRANPRSKGMTSTADEKDAIRELMARYCHALDACNFSEVASLFAEDGEWTTTIAERAAGGKLKIFWPASSPNRAKAPNPNHNM